MPVDYSVYIQQLDTLLKLHTEMQSMSALNDLSDLPKPDRQSLVTRSVAAIHRIAGPSSTYGTEAKRLIDKSPQLHFHTSGIMGIVMALRDDLKAGNLQNLAEIVHAEVFSDFLDMARHLNDSGYKDAAAVIAGSTLESHLRGLATKNGLATTDANGKPIKADRLNAELAKASVYSLLDQKTVTAHLDLRNKAAHGQYAQYSKEQVDNLISGITDFISRMPA